MINNNQSCLERFGMKAREAQLLKNSWKKCSPYTKPLVDAEYLIQTEFKVTSKEDRLTEEKITNENKQLEQKLKKEAKEAAQEESQKVKELRNETKELIKSTSDTISGIIQKINL